MPKASPIQNVFSGGEVSPLMWARVDFPKYKNALKTCINWVAMVEGPLLRRPGTKFVTEVKDSTKRVRVVRFEFSVTQAYILEFGDLYVRVFLNHGQVLAPGSELLTNGQFDTSIASWTNASTGTATATWDSGDGGRAKLQAGATLGSGNAKLRQSFATTAGHTYRMTFTGKTSRVSYSVGTSAGAADIVALTGNSASDFTADFVSPTTGNIWVEIACNTFSATGYLDGLSIVELSTTPYEIATTYTEDEIFDLKFTQSADTLYIAHQNHAPAKLTRSAHTSWTLSTIAFQDGPYLDVNTTATTLTASGAGPGSITVTASAVTGINGGAGFKTTDIGRAVRIKGAGAAWGWGTITARADTTHVTVTIVQAVSTSATATWRLGLWSDTTRYPAAVTFYQDRLVYGGSTAMPQTVVGSRTGAYENWAPTDYDTAATIANDHAYSFTLNSRDVQLIRWMIGDEKGLMVGTVRGEWILRSSSSNAALSPTNVSANQSTNYGSNAVDAVRAGKAALFIDRSGRKLREFAYDYTTDGFRAPNMTVLSSHITRPGVVDMAFQQEPHSVTWAARSDGAALAFTYDREQNTFAWTRSFLGGFSDAAQTTPAIVESVAVIPEPNGTYDELWMVVQRYINGATKRYIEYLMPYWEDGDTQTDAFYVDCGLTYDGTPATTISGLDHLKGQTVSILADGAAHPDRVVNSSGRITLALSASTVQIGLPYNSDWETLRMEAGAADGTAQGKTQRVHHLTLRLLDTLGVQVGPDFDHLEYVEFRSTADEMSEAVPLFTGDFDVSEHFDEDYTTEALVCGRIRQPFPAILQALMPQLHTQDR